jgi:hypothetical protein
MMTIKQQGGIFGRNPTFNDVDVEGTLTVNGEPISDFGSMAQQDADSVNIDGGAIDGTTIGLTTPSTGDFTTITGEAVKSGYIADFRNTRSNQDAGGLYVQTRYNNSVNSILKLSTNSGSATALEVRGDLDMDVYGSIIMKNSGEGIDFSATSDASGSQSELLSDYEHGTWTVTDQSAAGLTFTNPTGQYVRVGRFVSAFAAFTFPTTSDTNNASIGGLPYSALDDNSARATGVITYSNYAATHSLWIYGPRNSGQFLIIDSAANAKTNANLSGKTFYVQFNYQT